MTDCWCCRNTGISRPATGPDGLCDGCRDNHVYVEEGSPS